MTSGWHALVGAGRRGAALLTAIVFAVGAYEADRALSWTTIVAFVYFLGPFGLLRFGPRPSGTGRSLRIGIAVANLPFLVILIALGGPAVAVVLLATIVLAVADGEPPIRLRDRPYVAWVVDGALLALPALCGLLIGGQDVASVPWVVVVALFAWGIATAALRGSVATTIAVDAGTGAPIAAIVAVVGYGSAAVLITTLGTLGVIAALALMVFVALPTMVLFAWWRSAAPDPAVDGTPGVTSDLAEGVVAAAHAQRATVVAQASRAARAEWPGVAILVGGWLLILLLQHWSITTYLPWTAAVVVPAVLAGYSLANVIAIRVATRRWRVPSAVPVPGAPIPSLTIVVPSRDSIRWLPTGLAGVRAQTYPDTTILVVDDASTDGSVEEAGAWLGSDAVVSAPPRPVGLSSRSWARLVGARQATSDLILFVDADTVLAPVAARIMVEQLDARGDDLLLGLPSDAMLTPAERAAVPGFALVRYGFAPLWSTAVTRGRPANVAPDDGAVVLARRTAWLDDAGRRTGLLRLADLAATRRYTDADGVIAAWRARILPIGRGLAGAIGIVLLVVAADLAPLLLPPAAILADMGPDVITASLVPLAILLLMRSVLAVTQRQPLASIAWHPVTVGLMLVGQVAGIVDHVLARDIRPVQQGTSQPSP